MNPHIKRNRRERTKTVLPDVYTTLSFPELNLVDAPRAVTGFGGYKPAFLYDIVVVVVVMDAADARSILKVSLDIEEERFCCDGDCGRDQTRCCCATRQGVRSSFQKGKLAIQTSKA